MSKTTTNLKLFKYDPATDGSLTFNIDEALNNNWDKIDEKVKNLEDGTDDAVSEHNEASDAHSTLFEKKADLVDGKVPSTQLPEISSVKTYTATIGTTWTEDEDTGVKTQTVTISGVTASQTAKVDHAYTGSGTSEDYATFVEAENQYLTYITNGYAETVAGGIKFTIFGDANTVSIPIIVEVA